MSYGAQSDRTENNTSGKNTTLPAQKTIRNGDVAGFYTNLADGPLKSNTPAANLGEAMAAELVHLPLKLRVEPTANVARYDGLRQSVVPSAANEVQP
jgi:hypothetical protein